MLHPPWRTDESARRPGRLGAAGLLGLLLVGAALLRGPGGEGRADTGTSPSRAAAALASGADDGAAEKAAELGRLLRRLREKKKQRAAARAERARTLEELRARKLELALSVAAEKRRRDEEKRRASELEGRGRALRERLSERAEAASRVRAVLADKAAALQAFVRNGVPFDVEGRLEPIAAFRRTLEEGDPVAAARTLKGLHDYEISLGSTSSAFQGRISLGTERPRTRYMRAGLSYMAFVTEDGSEAGVLARRDHPLSGRSEYVWETDLGYFTRWRIRQAVDIAEKRRPPAMLELPVPLGEVKKR